MPHYYSEEQITEFELFLVKAVLRGHIFEFLTASGVFSYKKVDLGTRLLVETMEIPNEGTFLDLGCGYGVIGIVAAKINERLHVIMTDINRRAVMLARENAKRNGVRNVKVIQGDLYEPVRGMKFNAIVSNPPIHKGLDTVIKLIKLAPIHLKNGGTLQIVAKRNKGAERIMKFMEETFGNLEILAKKKGYFVFLSRLCEAPLSKPMS